MLYKCSIIFYRRDEILKLQSTICGQLGSIVLVLNHIHSTIVSGENNLNDVLIDNYISAIDAALMLKPYMKAEENNIENSIKNVFKVKPKCSFNLKLNKHI